MLNESDHGNRKLPCSPTVIPSTEVLSQEMARLIHAITKARDGERNSGRPDERLIKKCEEDLEAIETASRARLILFVERLITEQLQSDHALAISGSDSGEMPSKEMIEGMRIQTRRREMQRHAVCARLETLIYRGKTGEAPAVTGVSQEGW